MVIDTLVIAGLVGAIVMAIRWLKAHLCCRRIGKAVNVSQDCGAASA